MHVARILHDRTAISFSAAMTESTLLAHLKAKQAGAVPELRRLPRPIG
jgi:hypothetical protein